MKCCLQAVLACLLALWSVQTQAQDTTVWRNAPNLPDDCVTHAAQRQDVNPWILRAIIQVESGFNPAAIHRNTNGTLDVGLGQINSLHFKELRGYGIQPSDLLDACVSADVAAWHLRKQFQSYGVSWTAVGAYHSTTPCYNKRYVGLVWNVLLNWNLVQGTPLAVVPITACAARSGRRL